MSAGEALSWATAQLKKFDSPQLDAAILLSAAMKKPKEFLYTYPEKKLTPAQIVKFKNFISRRGKHEPLAYIIGRKEFYGFEFLVNRHVLIPRPDTETLISAVLSTVGGREAYSIIDVGTGSGAIAVTLKKLLPQARVFASDINPHSLALAKKNARRLGAKITFKKGNLLSPLKSLLSATRPPIITANLPYLSQAEWRDTRPEVKNYEPKGALVGGKTGTEIYEKLFKEVASYIGFPTSIGSRKPNISLFIEIGWNQKSTIAKLAKKILRPPASTHAKRGEQKIEFFKDLAGHWRVAEIILSSR